MEGASCCPSDTLYFEMASKFSIYVCELLAFLTYILQENALVSFTAVITNGGHKQTIRFCQPYKFQNKSITHFGIKMCHSLMSIIRKTVPDFLHYKPNIRNDI